LFGGLPATGAIARTATNVRAGAKTPVAGMIHALTLLAIVLFAAPLVKNVPLAALAAILMIVAYNMGDWEEIPEILKLSKADIAVWLPDADIDRRDRSDLCRGSGDGAGGSDVYSQGFEDDHGESGHEDYVEDSRVATSCREKTSPTNAIVYRIHGPFLFGATDKFSSILIPSTPCHPSLSCACGI